MALLAFERGGILRRDARVLGVGAGTETTLFYLTRHVGRVVATDLYASPGIWGKEAPPSMLTAPEKLSPIPFERERLEVLHMDGRLLGFPDESFDGVFSSSSVEHFGDEEDIAASCYEAGRVLRPGGVLSISTEYLIAGPDGAFGWPGVRLLDRKRLERIIIEASGLELMDPLDPSVSDETLATRLVYADVLEGLDRGVDPRPHIVLAHEDQVFTSVHVALRKTDRYPVSDNTWAKPSERIRTEVRHADVRTQTREAAASAVGSAAPSVAEAPASSPEVLAAFHRWNQVRAQHEWTPGGDDSLLGRAVAFARRTAGRIRTLGMLAERERDLFQALIRRTDEAKSEVAADPVSNTDERVAQLQFRLDALQAAVASQPGGVERVILEARIADLERQTRALDQKLRETFALARAAGTGRSEPIRPRRSPRSMAAIFALLEQRIPDLAGCTSVDVSIQADDAERLVLDTDEYFGRRMAARGERYVAPNDLWIHLDLSDHRGRASLFENAASRLGPEGMFILLVPPDTAFPTVRAGLAEVLQMNLTDAAGLPLMAHAWRKSGKAKRSPAGEPPPQSVGVRSIDSPLRLRLGSNGSGEVPVAVTAYLGKPFVYPRGSLVGEHIGGGGSWDAILGRIASLLPGDAPLVCEVGANIGASLLQILAAKPSARVISFEPSSRFRPIMEINVRLAGHERSVEIIPWIVGREQGKSFFYNDATSGSTTPHPHYGEEAPGRELCQVTTLDAALSDRGRFDLIKIDTDGYDFEVIRGAQGLLQRDRPVLHLEVAPWLMREDPVSELEHMQSLGYRELICFDPMGGFRKRTRSAAEVVSLARECGGYCDVTSAVEGTEQAERLARAEF